MYKPVPFTASDSEITFWPGTDREKTVNVRETHKIGRKYSSRFGWGNNQLKRKQFCKAILINSGFSSMVNAHAGRNLVDALSDSLTAVLGGEAPDEKAQRITGQIDLRPWADKIKSRTFSDILLTETIEELSEIGNVAEAQAPGLSVSSQLTSIAGVLAEIGEFVKIRASIKTTPC